MRKRVGKRFGDTLIEVALAVGIFSMVAIAIVSVMNRGSSGAQTSLETTLAREEIDAQAEALRFIHSAYIADRGNSNSEYVKTWRNITGKAVAASSVNEAIKYAPTSCADPYNSSNVNKKNAFIINTRNLGLEATSGKFVQASTYPRLIYKNDPDNLLGNGSNTDLSRVEGIFIIAVQDTATDIISGDGDSESRPAYFDFYIRTCWYGSGTDTPSTISTVIRLYDPDAIQQANSYGTVQVTTYRYDNVSTGGITQTGKKITLTKPTRSGNYVFYGWCNRAVQGQDTSNVKCDGEVYQSGTTFTNTKPGTTDTYTLYAMWGIPKYLVQFDSNGSSWTKPDMTCYWDQSNSQCAITSDTQLTRSGYRLNGWCSGTVSGATCSGKTYKTGDSLLPDLKKAYPLGGSMKLTAIWTENNETITIRATWTSSDDYDSYIAGKKSDGSSFSAYYGSLAPSETVNGVTRILAQLDHDGRGSTNSTYNETFTINTLGGRNYYYYIKNYSGSYIGNDITVNISGPYLGSKTYYSKNKPSSTCVYWNVFAYKDGQIVDKNTCTSNPSTSY